MGDDRKKDDVEAPEEPRPAGVLVAVRVTDPPAIQSAQDAQRETGASDIEIATGNWRDGA